MKLVIAYIRPERQQDVKAALAKHQIFRYVMTPVLAVGEEPAVHEQYRGVDIEIDTHKKVRFEIAVNDAFVQPTLDALKSAGHTGQPGDGHVLVLHIEHAVRIRDAHTGGEAIA